MKHVKKFLLCALVMSLWCSASLASEPLVIEEQGSFMIGGSTVSSDGPLTPPFWDRTMAGLLPRHAIPARR